LRIYREKITTITNVLWAFPGLVLEPTKVSEGEASPTHAFKAYLLCGISILIYGGIWLFLGHEVVQFLVRFPVHGVFERCGVAGGAEGFGQRRFDRAE
jgi:hypothetical protein